MTFLYSCGVQNGTGEIRSVYRRKSCEKTLELEILRNGAVDLATLEVRYWQPKEVA